jgi:hypothetical protein
MVDWIAIAAACMLTAAIGLGFVLWEHYESRRVTRGRMRRRPVGPAVAPVVARARLDVRRRPPRAA